jgi:hypothetical protein
MLGKGSLGEIPESRNILEIRRELVAGRKSYCRCSVQAGTRMSRKASRVDRVIQRAALRKLEPLRRDRVWQDHTIITMPRESQATAEQFSGARTPPVTARPRWKSEAGIDLALLACALFLQRFSLSFGNSLMSLDVVPALFILIHQFAAGRLLIVYDRLLWFLALGLATTCSLLLNFKSTMLPSYSEFIVMYFLFTLSRPATSNRYKSTLQAFQFLVLVLSFLAIAQFFAQFVVDGRELVQFFGIIPDYLLASYSIGGVNTIIPIAEGSSLIKSNGIFLTEPSALSQMTALAILIEILEFHRSRYLFLLAFGYLLSYSGTGLMTLLLCLPLSGLVHKRAIFYGLLAVVFVVGLGITGIVDLSVFVGRLGEFEDTRGSGFARFVAPFWLAADYLDVASVRALLLGNGPGTTAAFTSEIWYSGGMTGTWIKLFYEYGLIGTFVFISFFAACCRRTLCPGVLLLAILFTYVFLGGNILSTPFLIVIIVLVTLSGPAPRRARVETTGPYPPPLKAASGAG